MQLRVTPQVHCRPTAAGAPDVPVDRRLLLPGSLAVVMLQRGAVANLDWTTAELKSNSPLFEASCWAASRNLALVPSRKDHSLLMNLTLVRPPPATELTQTSAALTTRVQILRPFRLQVRRLSPIVSV